MAELTPRTGMVKSAGTEKQSVKVLNDNFDKIDKSLGAQEVTSTLRPTSPYLGQIIYETDTKRTLLWRGNAWGFISGPPQVADATAGALNLNTYGATWADIPSGPSITIDTEGWYLCFCRGTVIYSIAANFAMRVALNFWHSTAGPRGESGDINVTAGNAVLTDNSTVEISRVLYLPAGVIFPKANTQRTGGTQSLGGLSMSAVRLT